MSVGQVAVRYAKALFLSAKDNNVLDDVREDMELMLETLKEIPEIILVFESPIIDSGKKASILAEIFNSGMSPLGLNFLAMVTSNKREDYLPGMAQYFLHLYKQEKGIKAATILSAVRLDKKSIESIKQMIMSYFKSKIELNEEIKEDLIGGFVLRVEDKQLDASVKGKLASIKKELQN